MLKRSTRILVVVPTMPHNLEYAKVCVQSLLDTTDWLIAVIVNGSDAEALRAYNFPISNERVKVLVTNVQGQCHAVNMGSKMLGNYDYLFITNDDMYYPKLWNHHLRFDWPCFSPNLIEPTNNNGSAPPFLKLDAGFTLEEFKQEVVDKFVSDITTAETIEAATTGFNFPVFIKKDLWDLIGGYDEKYDPWGSNSDTDLQTLIELAGVQPMRDRSVLVYHFSNKSGTFDGTHQEDWQRNFDYYRDKFGYTRDDAPTDTWMAQGLVQKDKLKFHPDWEGKYK